jgi:uncharacterized protein
MQMQHENHPMPYRIDAYDAHSITVNGTEHRSSLIISETALIAPWRPHNLESLQEEDWNSLLAHPPELLLLGTGRLHHSVPPALLARLYERKIAVEVMSTGAACRTFMALNAEGRDAAAALLIS